MVSGIDFYSSISTDDKPRNYQYELLVAEKMKTFGYSINFDELTDVVATRGDDAIYIECKRIKSPKGLESNYRKACKQLKKVENNAYKLVFIDVFNCYFSDINTYEYINVLDVIKTVNAAYWNKFYKPNEKLINSILDEYKATVYGVAFTAIGILWLSSVEPQYYDDTQILIPQNISNKMENKIKALFNYK